MQNASITCWNTNFRWQLKHIGEISNVDLLVCTNDLLIGSTWLLMLGTWNWNGVGCVCVQTVSVTWSDIQGHDVSQHTSFMPGSSSIRPLHDFQQLFSQKRFSPEERDSFSKCCPRRRGCFFQIFQSLERFQETIKWLWDPTPCHDLPKETKTSGKKNILERQLCCSQTGKFCMPVVSSR